MKIRKTLEEKKITKVSFELGVPESVVEESISVLFKYMKGKIEEPQLAGDAILSSEDFSKNVPILKIPGLGFMVPNYKKYLCIKANELKKNK
jgi:hypothetical protein